MTRVVLVAGCLAILLAGCGKFGGPSPVGPPDQVTFPKTYPTQ